MVGNVAYSDNVKHATELMCWNSDANNETVGTEQVDQTHSVHVVVAFESHVEVADNVHGLGPRNNTVQQLRQLVKERKLCRCGARTVDSEDSAGVWYGIDIFVDDYFILSQCMHLTDTQIWTARALL